MPQTPPSAEHSPTVGIDQIPLGAVLNPRGIGAQRHGDLDLMSTNSSHAHPDRHNTATDGDAVGTVGNGVAPDGKVAVSPFVPHHQV
jgi:hypothetical protein